MICDKCGKSNLRRAKRCAHCGEPMPLLSDSNGFSDILSSGTGNTEARDETAKLLKKTERVVKLSRKNFKISLISLVVSILVLISSVIFGIICTNSIKKSAKEATKEVERLIEKAMREEGDDSLENEPDTNDENAKKPSAEEDKNNIKN